MEQWLEIRYGNWPLTALYILMLSVFIFGVLRPRTKIEWRSAGAAQAFVMALYAEMYGLPLTMYILSWWTGKAVWHEEHFRGHAWSYLMGWGESMAIALDVIGQCIIVIGAILAMVGWRQVHRAQGRMVNTGLYRKIRHPQYTGFILFLTGSLINWPTLPTLIMYPILIWVYYRLARHEEIETQERCGIDYSKYRDQTGMFFPRLSKSLK
jgi:protein-S-isoprenylcysteine O-methyltransferase Ste14